MPWSKNTILMSSAKYFLFESRLRRSDAKAAEPNPVSPSCVFYGFAVKCLVIFLRHRPGFGKKALKLRSLTPRATRTSPHLWVSFFVTSTGLRQKSAETPKPNTQCDKNMFTFIVIYVNFLPLIYVFFWNSVRALSEGWSKCEAWFHNCGAWHGQKMHRNIEAQSIPAHPFFEFFFLMVVHPFAGLRRFAQFLWKPSFRIQAFLVRQSKMTKPNHRKQKCRARPRKKKAASRWNRTDTPEPNHQSPKPNQKKCDHMRWALQFENQVSNVWWLGYVVWKPGFEDWGVECAWRSPERAPTHES